MIARLPYACDPRTALFAAALAVACAAAGCQAFALVDKVQPPPRAPAVHRLAGEPTAVVVVVDRSADSIAAYIESEPVAAAISRDLRHVLAHQQPKATPEIVDSARVAHAQSVRGFWPESARHVARDVGATQLILVELRSFGGTLKAEQIARGAASATVRVIDVPSGMELWPDDGLGGRPISVEVGPLPHASADTAKRQALADLSDTISRLFYLHYQEDGRPVLAPLTDRR